MSAATARAKAPVCSTRSLQSSAAPGLPCTKTTASSASPGPAWSTGDRTPEVTTSSFSARMSAFRCPCEDHVVAGVTLTSGHHVRRVAEQPLAAGTLGDEAGDLPQDEMPTRATARDQTSGGPQQSRRRQHLRGRRAVREEVDEAVDPTFVLESLGDLRDSGRG